VKMEGYQAENEAKLPKRWGDQKVSITDVIFLDKFSRESGRFSSSDPMTIRIFYSTPTMIRDPVFGIALYSEQDQYLYGTNTELKKITIDQIEGDGYVDLVIETIPMLSGHFQLTVAIQNHEGNVFDWIDKQYSFEVLSKGSDEGIFDIPCKWLT